MMAGEYGNVTFTQGLSQPAAGPGHRTASTLMNTIPDCEESFAMMFSLEDVIELCQHLIGLVHVGPG
jgi:hypothetical protein